jgi:hypothetical protein
LLELEDKQHADLVKDWNFKKGRDFEDAIFANYRSSVQFPSSPLGAFHLLVVFHRYTFRLTNASVSMTLHSCLGGMPAHFHVQFLKDCHYRISVASKRVGFAVTYLKRIVTPHFDVYFHLWRDGGANWQREWSKWVQEEEASWMPVNYRRRSSSIKHVSFAKKLIYDSPPKKSSPLELSEQFKFGSLDFALSNDLGLGWLSSNSNLNTQDPIPVKRVFGRFKKDFQAAKAAPKASSSDRDIISPMTPCKRCLRVGHLWKDSSTDVRCRWCYAYGHIQKFCFKKCYTAKSLWWKKTMAQSV